MRSKQYSLVLVISGGVVLTVLSYLFVMYASISPVEVQRRSGVVSGIESVKILATPWEFTGSKSLSQQYADLPLDAIKGKNILKITYNLHGVCILDGISSAVSLIQRETKKTSSVSLASYGKNCKDGEQSADIPLEHFSSIDWSKPVDGVSATFWYSSQYSITIYSIIFYNSGSVLGISNDPPKKKEHKTFDMITPIRPFPYARRNQ